MEPGRTCAARRRRCSGETETWLFLRKSRGEGCVACIAEVWQSVSPQKYLASWQYLGRIRTHLRIRPKRCYFVMPCRKEYGLPRRSAPRNDMQKENRFCGCKNVVPNDMLKLAACPCNTGVLPVYCRNSPLQPGQTALRFSTAPAPGHPSLCILQALPYFYGKTVAFFRKMCYTMLSIIRF